MAEYVKYTLQIEEDENGEPFLTLPEELLNQMGWDPGDVLMWDEHHDGSWLLRKMKDNE